MVGYPFRFGRVGISTASIETEAHGETQLLGPTADGVREPQNHRVEIVIER